MEIVDQADFADVFASQTPVLGEVKRRIARKINEEFDGSSSSFSKGLQREVLTMAVSDSAGQDKFDAGPRMARSFKLSAGTDCRMYHFLHLKNFVRDQKEINDILRDFQVLTTGIDFHRRWQALFKYLGMLVAKETEEGAYCDDADMRTSSRCDAVVLVDGKKHLVELKSANSTSMKEFKKAASAKHVQQLNGYLNQLDAEIGSVLYEDKSSHHLVEHVVKRNRETWEEHRRFAHEVFGYIDTTTIPPRDGINNGGKACKYCEYSDACGMTDASILQKIAEKEKEIGDRKAKEDGAGRVPPKSGTLSIAERLRRKARGGN